MYMYIDYTDIITQHNTRDRAAALGGFYTPATLLG